MFHMNIIPTQKLNCQYIIKYDVRNVHDTPFK